jgi:hypothetical protein
MVMGPETKNDCAGEGQQQITAFSSTDIQLYVRGRHRCDFRRTELCTHGVTLVNWLCWAATSGVLYVVGAVRNWLNYRQRICRNVHCAEEFIV